MAVLNSDTVRGKRLIWPASGLNVGEISKSFGAMKHPLTKEPIWSTSISIPGPAGTPIVSPADGVVVKAGNDAARGNSVLIKCDGLSIFLMHMDKLNVLEGQIVGVGETVGTLGATGIVTGPNVSVAVYVEGIPIDPMMVNWE